MSLSSKSSRRNSLSSLFNLGNNADNAQHERNLHDDEQHHASGSNEEGPPHAEHSNHNRRISNKNDEDDIEPPRYLTYTQNHPMGRLFLALFRENVKNSKKELDLNIEDLCCDFYHAMQLERDNTHRTVQQAARGMEQDFLNRDLNAHTINMSFPPPSNFSKHPTWTTVQQKSDCLRQFPTRPKFGGTGKDGTMDIIEFLNALNAAQEDCKLSEKEFKNMLLACSTGRPHSLLMEWIANGDDIPTIYHNLLLHFDKRISPESARQQLYSYRAPKTTTLAGAEAHIMALASRASSMIPAGPTRNSTYNLESIQALIRCLPKYSSDLVLTKFNELTARQRHAPTAAELSRMLYTSRHVIDQDIKAHGNDKREEKPHPTPLKGRRGLKINKYASSYAVVPVNSDFDYRRVSRSKGGVKRYPPIDNTTYTYSAQGEKSPSHPHKYNRDKPGKHIPERNKSGRFVAKHGNNNFKHNSRPTGGSRYCSLCGQNSHTITQGCPNMVNNEGKVVSVMPTMGTCPVCPPKIKQRLNHPSALCPYRRGAPLEHA